MFVTAVSDVTTVAIAPVPDPVTLYFVYVPAVCVADLPVVLSNNASAVVNNSKSSATNVNFKFALLLCHFLKLLIHRQQHIHYLE